ncbi:MAG: acyloxyacyl hydrolase [Proteobacteria bacterium]|nr:acyloxyacyl hydrolase [Pseudomonadota bacterium]
MTNDSKKARRTSWPVLLLCLVLVFPPAALAAERAKPNRWRFGFSAAYGAWTGVEPHQFNVVTLRGFVSFRLTRADLMTIRLRIEGLVAGYQGDYYRRVLQADKSHSWIRSESISAVELGVVPSLVLSFGRGWFRPYFEAGVGVTYNGLDTATFAPGFNFRSHAGLGVSFSLGKGARLMVGTRLSHVSNAGLSSRNVGLTFFEALIGVSFPM